MARPISRRQSALRAAIRGSILRFAFRSFERYARAFPGKYPMVDRETGRLKNLLVDKLGRYEAVGPGIGMIHSFANIGVIMGSRHLVLVDTTDTRFSRQALLAIRGESQLPIQTIVLTHGHIDHIGGLDLFLQDAVDRGEPRPEVWAQERIQDRFARYERTWGWNNEINRRQFGFAPGKEIFPRSFPQPDVLVGKSATLDLDGEPIELFHAEAETDDALWLWLPQRQAAFVGDLLIHSLPNAGNPNKVQRNTLGWALALEAVAEKQPQYLIPGHQQAVQGALCEEMLRETARALRYLHDAVVDRLNNGRWPEEIASERIQLPVDLRGLPYLGEIYGCAEFIVRDVLRQYAGWWDGNPARLFPLPRAKVSSELAGLIGAERLKSRILELVSYGQHEQALELAVILHDAHPRDAEVRQLLAKVLDDLATAATSFIARNLYGQQRKALLRGPGAE